MTRDLTVRMNGKTVITKRIEEPIWRYTFTLTWPGLLRALLRFRRFTLEMTTVEAQP